MVPLRLRPISVLFVVTLAVAPLALATPGAMAAPKGSGSSTSSDGLVYRRMTSPARTVVSMASGQWVATFTDGAATVTIAGSERTFSEPSATSAVRSTTWVRVLPAPFTGTVDTAWLTATRADTSPDVLALATQYLAGAAEVRDASGLLVSSDASYGPLLADGTRQEGSDWNDYLGVDGVYGGTIDAPEPHQAGALDCSGYLRMLWGRRAGMPLTLAPDGRAIPRRAHEIQQSAPGFVTITNRGSQVTSFDRLAPGDLVFFDAATDDGTQIDHVGMYLGPDTAGRHRFVSSRKAIDGPTMGDYRGMSVLDGSGLYAKAFRSARRL